MMPMLSRSSRKVADGDDLLADESSKDVREAGFRGVQALSGVQLRSYMHFAFRDRKMISLVQPSARQV